MPHRSVYFVGSFYDQPSRILQYATAARALCCSPSFVRSISDIPDDILAGRDAEFIFTDETAICDAYDILAANKIETPVGQKIISLMHLSDKFHLRRISQLCFPHPHFMVKTPEDMEQNLPLEGTWLCKPRWGSNSRDVQKFENAGALKTSVLSIVDRNNHALVEKHIEGRHICVDFVWDGGDLKIVGYCQKRMTNFSRKIVEAFHSLDPSIFGYADKTRVKLRDMFDDHFAGVKFAVHGEFIIENGSNDIYIAELNPRAPWGLLPELFSVAHGLNFDEIIIANAIGRQTKVSLDCYPVVLGAVFTKNFFTTYEALPGTGNTLFIEQFEATVTSDGEAENLTKFGRYLVWGKDGDAVLKEWQALSEIALPEHVRNKRDIGTASTWKSKCC